MTTNIIKHRQEEARVALHDLINHPFCADFYHEGTYAYAIFPYPVGQLHGTRACTKTLGKAAAYRKLISKLTHYENKAMEQQTWN